MHCLSVASAIGVVVSGRAVENWGSSVLKLHSYPEDVCQIPKNHQCISNALYLTTQLSWLCR